jgi:prepilin-type processing-associated H-X9-DG protein
MLLYANENRGKYPDDFEQIMRTQDLVPEVFINPRTGHDLQGDDVDARIKFASEQGDYFYAGKGLKNDTPAETVVAFEKPDGLDDGINILFGDGHVEFVMMEHALPMIDEAKARHEAAGGGGGNGL